MAASINQIKTMEKLQSTLNRIDISKLSRATGFVKRDPLKARCDKFLLGFLNAVFNHESSLMCIAFSIGQLINDTISKVAVRKQLNSGFATFLNRILAVVLSDQLQSRQPIVKSKSLSSFANVYFQDSTTISLSAKLASVFPGSGNKTGKRTATLKIQLIYSALSEHFSRFEIGSFRDNDQKASPLILKVARAGDLVIRDLGYLVLDVFAQMHQQGIFFLSRYRHNINIYTEDGDSRIDLVKLIKKHMKTSKTVTPLIDLNVKMGAKLRLPVRLVIVPLSQQIANERRRKAKNNRDKRLKPDKNRRFLMAFNIFISNVDRKVWTPSQITKIYQLRWRIEIIFKSWKSHFHITQVPSSTTACLKAYIYACFIYITLIHRCIFIPLFHTLYEKQQKHLSLLKVTKLLSLIQHNCFILKSELDEQQNLIQQILYHAGYDNRNNRDSYPQMLIQ